MDSGAGRVAQTTTLGWLRVVRPGRTMWQVAIGQSPFVMGRGSTCHLVLDEEGIEPEHATVELRDGEAWLVSRGGNLVVNSRPQRARRLIKGDVITVGQHHVVFLPGSCSGEVSPSLVRALANGSPPLVRQASPLGRQGGDGGGPSLQARAEVTAWIERIRRAALEARNVPAVAARIASVAETLAKAEIVVAFAGHFSSGKSTLINALLGVEVMPTDERPDTGTLCLIRPGGRDTAQVCSEAGTWTIPCTEKGLREAVSLYAHGNLNSAVHQISCLELTLANLGLPSQQVWMDTPGINESSAMEVRVAEAMEQADIVVWVLNSVQFLSMTEQKALRRFREWYNPHAFVYVLNVFLGMDTAKRWANYQRQILPTLLERLRDAAESVGFARDSLPTLLPVCARGLGGGRDCDYGGKGLGELLMSFRSCHHPDVMARRLYRARAALGAVREELQAAPSGQLTQQMAALVDALVEVAPEPVVEQP